MFRRQSAQRWSQAETPAPATIPAPDDDSGRVRRAILIALAALFCFDSMALVVKLLIADYSAQQLSVYRNLAGVPPCLLLLFVSRDWRAGGRRLLMPAWRLALLRGVFIAGAQFLFYSSLAHMEFATASTLAFATPLFITAMSAPILGDKVGVWRWSAVLIGFLGVVLVMEPGGELFAWRALLPIGAAFFYASSVIVLRLMPAAESSALINLYQLVGATAVATLICAATEGFAPLARTSDLWWILLMGIAGSLGVLLLVIAYRMTQPSNLAPFEYFGIVISFALGWIFFGEAPFDRLIPGVFLIAGGGLLIVWRQRRRHRVD